MIPAGRSVRVVGDVHGDARAFAHALASDHFVVQLGDLTDGGPDSAGVLRMAFDMVAAGRGIFLLGNHDAKLWRVLHGQKVRVPPPLRDTLGQMDAALKAETAAMLGAAPAWLRWGDTVFVHAAFHRAMLYEDAPPVGLVHAEGAMARALYGQTTGRIQGDGYPERVLGWVDEIPPHVTVYCGHDRRSPDGRPLVRRGMLGGRAIFLDTGAGKGGHLSWIDLPQGET